MWARTGFYRYLGFAILTAVATFFMASVYTDRLSYYASTVVNPGRISGNRAYSVDMFSPSRKQKKISSTSLNSSTPAKTTTSDLSLVKLLCFVETCAKNIKRMAAIKRTWGKRCDKVLYISDQIDDSIPTITLPGVLPGYEHLWSKTLITFQHLYEQYANQFDWFLKTDDDTFIIVENLKYFLAQHNPNEPHYFGKRFKTLGGYTSGGAGYVISKRALVRFGTALKQDSIKCTPLESKAPEDNAFGKCLKHLNIIPGETIDQDKKELFHSFNVNGELANNVPDWMYKYAYYPVQTGMDCCGNYTISFHYVSPQEMKMIEAMLYRLRVYGEDRERGRQLIPNWNKYYLQRHHPDNTLTDSSPIESKEEVVSEQSYPSNKLGRNNSIEVSKNLTKLSVAVKEITKSR